ncbi:MAG: hypothetical protein CENE_03432 [Candidatus Celerinatantimonas neptuna]|nr:MAG: hypothetical protein CENE_03432 [Candidatus Celerinatantimonas neptuna]
MMRQIMWLILLCAAFPVWSAFVNPSVFDGSAQMNQELNQYIHKNTVARYCHSSDTQLHCNHEEMKRYEFLERQAFNKAIHLHNQKIMNQAIFDVCHRSNRQCSYQNIIVRYYQIKQDSAKFY